MVVSSNYNLIPYPNHNYHVLTYDQDNVVAHQHRDKEFLEPYKLLRRSQAVIEPDTIHFDSCGNSYDATYCLQYSAADQVGRMVDVYA